MGWVSGCLGWLGVCVLAWSGWRLDVGVAQGWRMRKLGYFRGDHRGSLVGGWDMKKGIWEFLLSVDMLLQRFIRSFVGLCKVQWLRDR